MINQTENGEMRTPDIDIAETINDFLMMINVI